jgi:hypothetical protein
VFEFTGGRIRVRPKQQMNSISGQTDSDNEAAQSRTLQNHAGLAQRLYPTASIFLRALESCPDYFHLWAGNDPYALQSVVDQ